MKLNIKISCSFFKVFDFQVSKKVKPPKGGLTQNEGCINDKPITINLAI